MITYCYEMPDGTIHDHQAPMGKAPETIVVDGQTAHRSIAAEHTDVSPGNPWAKHKSLALMMVGKEQQLEHQAEAHAKGCEIGFDREGYGTFKSKKQRDNYMRAYKLADFNSYD